jgi:peptidoglycan/xylan/chitin deacetylase (PgdA/CDA1 family)
MGRIAPSGEIFSHDDLAEFLRQKHELGCHTFDHCHAWDTGPAEFEASILRNQIAIKKYLPEVDLKTCSYPISCPSPANKRRTAKHFECCRGGGQTFNSGVADLNQLKAFFIEQSKDDCETIERVIEDNARQKGWLIFATHDVSESPTKFGCSPELLEKVVRCVIESGARTLPVFEALQIVRTPHMIPCKIANRRSFLT